MPTLVDKMSVQICIKLREKKRKKKREEDHKIICLIIDVQTSRIPIKREATDTMHK